MYKIEKWLGGEPKHWELLEKMDILSKAIDFAREDNMKHENGTAMHRVVYIKSSRIMYVRGFINSE